jgi:hypothetical protein
MGKKFRDLGLIMSLVQVEFGLKDLETFWAAYSDFNEFQGIRFPDETELVKDITNELENHLEFLLKDSGEMGPKVPGIGWLNSRVEP